MKESVFQRRLIEDIEDMFPGVMIFKTDPGYIQGIPDLLILFEDKWAALEVKRDEGSHRQPNQEYYIHRMSEMGYASFVYPQNREEILDGLQRTFTPRR